MDAGVYAAWRTFRVPFSSAWSDGLGPKPPIGGPDFCAARFARGLVHVWGGDGGGDGGGATATTITPYAIVGGGLAAGATAGTGAPPPRAKKVRRWTRDETDDFARAVSVFLESGPGNVVVQNARHDEDNACINFELKGMPCPANADKAGTPQPHTRNRTFARLGVPPKFDAAFASVPRFPLHCTCSDPDCAGCRWFAGDFTRVCLREGEGGGGDA